MNSPFDGRSRRLLAWALAFLCAREMYGIVEAMGPSLPLVAVAAVGGVALLGFALRRWPIACGLAALACLSALVQLHVQAMGGPMRHEYAVGVALLGWLCGLLYARDAGVHAAEELAETGAVAALSATYVAAGISKLVKGHLVWAESATLRAMLAAHRPIDDASLFGAYAQKIIADGALAEALAWATLAVQLGAWMLLVGRRSRIVWGTLLLIFHLHVAYLTGIYYWGAIWLLFVYSYPWPLPRVLGSS
jgi:hypothetical protein